MQSGSGYWIGMSAGTRPFRHRFLEQMCMRAARQGIGAVFTTCWRSLVLKNVAPEHLPEWRMLLGRHGVRVRHADAALHWQVCDRLPEARELAGTMIARLSRRSIVTSDLGFAVTDDPTRHEVAVAIQPLAAERLPLSGLRRRYAVRHREGFAARPCPAPGTDRQTLIRLAQGRVLICPVPATENRVISVGVHGPRR